MANIGVTYRQADVSDAGTLASIARESRRHFLPYLPRLHSLEADQNFYRNRVFAECEVWVAEDAGEIVGFCAFKEGWVEHLYLRPSHVGQSIGKVLLDKAKARYDALHLWVFQRNGRAIGFYEAQGFRKIRETDGASNEEQTADALYEWRKP